MQVLGCEYCGENYAPGPSKSAVERLSKHIYHSGEPHPDVSYDEARTMAEQQGLDDDHDAGRPDHADGDRFDPTADAPDGNPIFRAPTMANEPAEDRRCPECNEPMDTTAAGHKVRAVTDDGQAARFVTESGDQYCADCEVIRSKSGEVFRGVSEQ